jgi:hypothetical protein
MKKTYFLLPTVMFLAFTLSLQAQYPFGNCIHLDGDNDYIILADESAFDFTVNMTVECWIKVDEWDRQWQAIIAKGDNAWRLHRDNQTSKIRFEAGGKYVTSNTEFNDSKWHHLAGVKDGAVLKLFVDGVQEAILSTAANNTNNSYQVRIGENAQVTGRYFDGVVEEVRFWDYARTYGDINENMYKTLAGNEAGLVAYYKLDETSGLTAFDATAAGHHGTLVNMTGNEWEPTTIPMVFPVPGYAVDFDGVDDYVNCGTILPIFVNQRTIEAWAYTRSFTGGAIFQVGNPNLGSQDFTLRTLPEEGKWRVDIGGTYLDVTLPFSKNSWHHYCLTYDGGQGSGGKIRFYYDGKLVATLNWGIWKIEKDLIIGKWSDYFFDGIVDEIRVWDTCRSQQDIINTINWPLVGIEPRLVAYYQCSFGSGTTIYDYTGGYNGIMYNMNNQDWVSSGAMQFDVQTLTIQDGFTGLLDFSNAGLCMNIKQKTGTDIYTVIRINAPPSIIPQFPTESFDLQHWLLVRQGSGTMNADLTFTVGEDILPADSICLHRIKLLYSTVYSSSWSLLDIADSVDYAGNTLTFDDISAFDMFLAGRQESPFYTALSPPDDYTRTGVNQDLVLTYDRPMFAGAGNLYIFNAPDSSLFEAIPASLALIDSNTVVFNPTGTLEHIASYFVLIDSTALFDMAGASIPGMYESDTWNFCTPWLTLIPTQVTAVKDGGGCRWGDYNNDGGLDIAVFGRNQSNTALSEIFRNGGADSFTDINAGLTGNYQGAAAWGDYDGDGDLDLIISGYNGNALYRNDGNDLFVKLTPWNHAARYGELDWGDFDNDGDLDILICGDGSASQTNIFRNNGDGTFTNINAGFPFVYGYWSQYNASGIIYMAHGRVRWVDYDLDGDLDVFLAGKGLYTNDYFAKLYRNDGPGTTTVWVFTEINAGFYGCSALGADWGDYDNDGDPDLILSGGKYTDIRSRIYKNNGDGSFSEIDPLTEDLIDASIEWGDLDNDGDLDFLYMGIFFSNNQLLPRTYIYVNEGNDVFVKWDTEFEGYVRNGNITWGDYDNDGDLDVMQCGISESNQAVFRLMRNNCHTANTPPTIPQNLSFTLQDNGDLTFLFGWDAAGDNETPPAGLSYNLSFQLLRNGRQVAAIPAMADTASGYRRIPDPGNAGQTFGHYLNYPELPMLTQKYRRYKILWGVQAIDHSFAGSPFNMSHSSYDKDIAYLATSNNTEMQPADWLTWEVKHQSSLAGYRVQVDEQAGFQNPLEEFIDINGKKGKLVQGDKGFTYSIALNELGFYPSLADNTVYHWRMRPVYTDGDSTCFTQPAPWFFFNKENTAPCPPVEGFTPAGDVAIGTLIPLIAWNAAFDPDSISDGPETLRYTIEVDTSNTFSSVIFTQTTAMGINYAQVNPSLLANHRYYYRVKTMDDEGLESAWSATQSFRVFDITLYLAVNLEGPFNGTGMNTSLNPAYLPLAQPYGTVPWYYTGTETVGSIPSADVVDWILVELRDAPNAQSATPATIIARQAAFLLRDGSVAGLDGNAPIRFYTEIQNNLFVVIHHRNHLSIMTPVSPPENNGTFTWDFTTGAGQAYGGVNAHKELAPGKWGMIAGDGNADRQVNNADKNDVWRPQSGSSGYKQGDFSMNGQVDNSDKIEKWKPNSGRSSQVPD